MMNRQRFALCSAQSISFQPASRQPYADSHRLKGPLDHIATATHML